MARNTGSGNVGNGKTTRFARKGLPLSPSQQKVKYSRFKPGSGENTEHYFLPEGDNVPENKTKEPGNMFSQYKGKPFLTGNLKQNRYTGHDGYWFTDSNDPRKGDGSDEQHVNKASAVYDGAKERDAEIGPIKVSKDRKIYPAKDGKIVSVRRPTRKDETIDDKVQSLMSDSRQAARDGDFTGASSAYSRLRRLTDSHPEYEAKLEKANRNVDAAGKKAGEYMAELAGKAADKGDYHTVNNIRRGNLGLVADETGKKLSDFKGQDSYEKKAAQRFLERLSEDSTRYSKDEHGSFGYMNLPETAENAALKLAKKHKENPRGELEKMVKNRDPYENINPTPVAPLFRYAANRYLNMN